MVNRQTIENQKKIKAFEEIGKMDDLLKVPEIVTNIASYLSTVDYLSFQQVNKRVYAIINGKNDSKYWSLKLTRMGLQQVHSNEEEEITLLDENDDQNSLRIFEIYKSFTAQNSKKIFVKFYRCYNSYARKLYNNNLANFFSYFIFQRSVETNKKF
ncbi:ANL_collapsed_G0027930.mRNA.1.CDS.1 [Saccharomyces cerevisiae]|nr:ANL_collapsed_G0027930.mRNA.1.CDS.1 [Saccharomyces cerevisiae]